LDEKRKDGIAEKTAKTTFSKVFKNSSINLTSKAFCSRFGGESLALEIGHGEIFGFGFFLYGLFSVS
jgi:hypothetical protein